MSLDEGNGDELLGAEVAAALDGRMPWLTFPYPLERQFEKDRQKSRNRTLRAGVLIAFAVYNLFLFCDFQLLPEQFLRCLVIRLGIVSPLVLGTYLWLRYDPPAWISESLIFSVGLILGFNTLYVWHGVGAVASIFAQAALILLILFVNVMMRLSFRYALIATLLGVLDGAAFLVHDSWLNGAQKMTAVSLVATGALFTLAANYLMEWEERNSYLVRVQSEARGRELASANRKLLELSNLDILTGIPNRRSFDLTLSRVWKQSVLNEKELSILLIDIDRFKLINDRFGHLCGDEILAQFGRVLRAGLRSDEGVAARIGGEEFAVLLPGVPLENALIIAERLRRLARTIRPVERDRDFSSITPPLTNTISIGAAVRRPQSHHSPKELLREADSALYQAKSGGRDRVWPPPAAEKEFMDAHFESILEQLESAYSLPLN